MGHEKDLNEEKCTARELLQQSGEVFDNFLLSQIVADAPSPKAADQHVTTILGWPNSVGRKVRAAAHLKEKFPAAWQAIRESKSSVHNLFGFEPGFYSHPADKITTQISTGLKCENWGRSFSHWPVLLREFSFPVSNQQLTSVDYLGGPDKPLTFQNLFVRVCAPNSDRRSIPEEERLNNCEIKIDTNGKTLKISTDRLIFTSTIKFCQEPNKSGTIMPVLRKFFEITTQDNPRFTDCIKGNIRLDAGPDLKFYDPPLGELTFTRSVPLTENRIDEAVFTASYDIREYKGGENNYLLCELAQYRTAPITLHNIRKTIEGDEPRFKKEDLTSAFAQLSELAEYFYHNPANQTSRHRFHPETILGYRFFRAVSVFELVRDAEFLG